MHAYHDLIVFRRFGDQTVWGSAQRQQRSPCIPHFPFCKSIPTPRNTPRLLSPSISSWLCCFGEASRIRVFRTLVAYSNEAHRSQRPHRQFRGRLSFQHRPLPQRHGSGWKVKTSPWLLNASGSENSRQEVKASHREGRCRGSDSEAREIGRCKDRRYHKGTEVSKKK